MKVALIVLTVASHLAMLTANGFSQAGSIDSTFNPVVVGNVVETVTLLNDRKILITGNFSSVNGIGREGLARLHPNGSLDVEFGPVEVPGGGIEAVVITSAGSIVIVGSFANVNGTPRYGIAKLRSDGSLDVDFNPPRLSGSKHAVGVQPDGKVLVAGHPAVWRLHPNGSLDSTFNSPAPEENSNWCITVDPDGRVLVGGVFTNISGARRWNIARLETDGKIDTNFSSGPTSGALGSTSYTFVNTIHLQADGKILLGGNFKSINGYSRQGIARLNYDGSVDTTFAPGMGFDTTGASPVESIATQSDGKIVVGGNFSKFNGIPQNKITRLNVNGTLDTSFNGAGVNGSVRSVAIQADGNLIVGGGLTSVENAQRKHLVRLRGGVVAPIETRLFPIRFFAGMEVAFPEGHGMRIDAATNLNPPIFWMTLTNLAPSPSPVLFIDSTSPSFPTRFYRAVVLP